ncbi:fructose-specific PTS transporter subunit EIIC [Pseudoroseomonas ludipueritiae]|uniref:protein-N(pi)-phosphohistidine--D-fructose phosphotransferase n=1 Tax=Pseudoroseomonas ludipueritiae TaxID=198093 RepID=A0ABR7R743_9PROT|nr:fructose-specific PTS transporter subunit EIIC [Pseudoroseomonas ludipueritiae]MBC9177589.1 PTS fructose transporter subunit EIIBC [Pseudoroseomonas ludipueritiae]
MSVEPSSGTPRLLGVIRHPASAPHAAMAAEALRDAARRAGVALALDTGNEPAPAGEVDAVLLVGEAPEPGQQGRPVTTVTVIDAIRRPEQVLRRALSLPEVAPPEPAVTVLSTTPSPVVPPEAPAASAVPAGGKKLVAITACPTGIAHTFMAAAALEKGAARLGHSMRVETQGSVGAKNALTPEEIAAADAVVIAADTGVDTSRFAGKRLITVGTGDALKDASGLINRALAAAPLAGAAQASGAPAPAKATQAPGVYKHLMTGVSYMIPLVTAGGLCIALSFAFGIEAFKVQGSLPAALFQIGAQSALALMVPVLAAFIAFSIADRPGLAPGFVGGALANAVGAGFLGGIAAGFLAGYVARFLRDRLPFPESLEGLKPVLVIPLLASLVTGLLMIYVLGTPIAAALAWLTQFLQGMGTSNAVLLGLLLGAMMAADMGGPVNKAAYAFGVGLLGTETFAPMAAIMAAGMTPPLGVALATFIARNRFSQEERDAGKAAAVLGAAFITEGAIPFAAKDPVRVIPALVAGSALAGGLSMWLGCTLRAPHGGIFVVGIPGAVGNPLGYLVAIVAGAVVTGLVLAVLKRGSPVAEVQA